MNSTRTWVLCVMVVSLNVCRMDAAQVLRAFPDKAELGTFNAFQIKETIVNLSNTGRRTFLIDKIKADCACIRTSISTKEMPPGGTVELTIVARERTAGEFSHDVLIIPKDAERYEPLKIRVTGKVIQPVCATIGWEGEKPTPFDPNHPLDLGLVHQLSVNPVIRITADGKHLNLREALPDVNSTLFELHSQKLEKLPVSDQMQTTEQAEERLVLLLIPKKPLKIGALRDLIRISLADDIGLEMPISWRIVGDVYAKEQIIHFGDLSDGAPKKFKIHFANNVNVWPDVKWEASGYLSDAVVVKQDDDGRTGSYIELALTIDQSKLSSLPKGYVFCRIKFFHKQPPGDNAVAILVDGFNKKSNL